MENVKLGHLTDKIKKHRNRNVAIDFPKSIKGSNSSIRWPNCPVMLQHVSS